jgi:hypothetical protein
MLRWEGDCRHRLSAAARYVRDNYGRNITPRGIQARHPGRERGDPHRAMASAEDIALTRRLAAGGQLLGIELLDHVILGVAGRFVSLRERGVL